MLRRKIETQLEAWRSAPKRTALLVTGARQIGKTYIIRHFAQQHYDHIAELNFIENPDLVALFDRPRDAKNLLMRLELAVNTPLVPGKTLIKLIFDVTVPMESKHKDNDIVDDISRFASGLDPRYRCIVTVDHDYFDSISANEAQN